MKMGSPPPRLHAARARLRRLLIILVITGAGMTAAALIYLSSYGSLPPALVAAVVFGVFVSILLGGGLMATGFYSADSGIDESVAGAQTTADAPTEPDGSDSL